VAELQVHPSSTELIRDREGTGALGHCWSHVTRRHREGVCVCVCVCVCVTVGTEPKASLHKLRGPHHSTASPRP
jgi:hypothetical protein